MELFVSNLYILVVVYRFEMNQATSHVTFQCPYEVLLSFQSIASEPTQAALQVARIELVGPDGRQVPVHADAWATVRLMN